jgi:hypothetical protein
METFPLYNSYYRRPSKCLVILYADAGGLTFLKPSLETRSALRDTSVLFAIARDLGSLYHIGMYHVRASQSFN